MAPIVAGPDFRGQVFSVLSLLFHLMLGLVSLALTRGLWQHQGLVPLGGQVCKGTPWASCRPPLPDWPLTGPQGWLSRCTRPLLAL